MPRHLPLRSLPPYSYVAGRYPHPHRDSNGHSHGVDVSEPIILSESESDWRECQSYLWGIDLLNAGFYWEAHEAWEQAWIRVGRTGTIADFLKALIKLAAAGVKAREGREAGVRRHALRSLELLSIPELLPFDRFLGLPLCDLRNVAQLIADQADDLTQRTLANDQAHVLPISLEFSSDG